MASPSFADAVFDGGLNFLDSNVTRIDLCTADPNGVYGSIAGSSVANYTVDGTDFTIANGDTSGRKITLSQQTGNNGTATGAANFLVLSNGTDTWYGTINADGDTVNSGSPVTINAVDIWEINDPT